MIHYKAVCRSLLVLVSLLCTGCATIFVHANYTPDKPRPYLYQGTLVDAVLATFLLDDECDFGEGDYGSRHCLTKEYPPFLLVLLAPFALVDLPASLVADTILLPYTLSRREGNGVEAADTSEPIGK